VLTWVSPQTASRSVQPAIFAQYVSMTNTETDTQTTLRVTSVVIGRRGLIVTTMSTPWRYYHLPGSITVQTGMTSNVTGSQGASWRSCRELAGSTSSRNSDGPRGMTERFRPLTLDQVLFLRYLLNRYPLIRILAPPLDAWPGTATCQCHQSVKCVGRNRQN